MIDRIAIFYFLFWISWEKYGLDLDYKMGMESPQIGRIPPHFPVLIIKWEVSTVFQISWR